MAKRSTNSVPNVELCRDIYGFTVRPQHFQKYKQYAAIYTEEEAERSARWERFLEAHCEDLIAEKIKSGIQEDHLAAELGRNIDNDGGRKLEMWGQVRPSLWPIEQALYSRYKKIKTMHSTGTSVSVAEAPSELAATQSVNSPARNSGVISEDEFEEFYDVERSDVVSDAASSTIAVEEGATGIDTNEGSEDYDEEQCPWKEELDALVQGGVPMALRGEVWQVFVGTKARRISGHYQALLTLLADGGGDSDGVGGLYKGTSNNYSLSDVGILEKWTSQIEKDLPRTFPGHPALDEDGRNALRRLLTAYARHNPDVGYCQAMNFFAALLLLMMPEENAFWTLTGFMDDYFEGYYSEKMLESQVDQLVLEELVRKHFPKLVSHLDALGLQVSWVTGPWFLSIFVNILPWESVLRVWDVLLYDGNRSMLFRTALALLDQHGSAILTTRDAGDAVTMLQSLAGSTFDSSHLVLIACMGYQKVDELVLQEFRTKFRPQVLAALSERSLERSMWSRRGSLSSKVLATQGTFKKTSHTNNSPMGKKGDSTVEDVGYVNSNDSGMNGDSDHAPNALQDEAVDEEEACMADLMDQVKWLKAELSRALVECRAANLRADELENAFMELVKEDNRRLLSAKVETLEDEVAQLRQTLADKEDQEQAMVKLMLHMEQEQRIADDARWHAEEDAEAQRETANALQAKYEEALSALAAMEKRTVMAESMLEATLQYQALDQSAPVPLHLKQNHNREVSRWSWPRLSPRTSDVPSMRTSTATTDGGVINVSKSSDTNVNDTPKPGLLSRRFSLGWSEKFKKTEELEIENQSLTSIDVSQK
ncbi:hypothetical protein KP509_17G059800 [Ceratopteris richardii]|uniref:Rab-GAP TBC domain-containing protein n=1 Tax=Ceratopteris richardii TaxID=49495 RepID=A0A8T2SVG1_CERRI|nr:hypothetical protein KP509_17G059800 [Ceratopteris richardii]